VFAAMSLPRFPARRAERWDTQRRNAAAAADVVGAVTHARSIERRGRVGMVWRVCACDCVYRSFGFFGNFEFLHLTGGELSVTSA
jgi:hypothetical protein